MVSQQIVLRQLDKPRQKRLPEDVFWLCDSFGFAAGRDVEQMASRIVLDVLQKHAGEQRISSEQIADDLTVSHARVNHHLRNLIDSGLLYREKKLIFLRGGSMKSAVQELRKDANRILDDLERMAEEVDGAVGLKTR